MKFSSLAISILFFGLICSGCSDRQQLVNLHTSEYSISLSTDEDRPNLDQLSFYSTKKIVFKNIKLKECLATLLKKDSSLIYFKDKKRGSILISGQYRSTKNLGDEARKIFLNTIQETLNIRFSHSYPDKTFQLGITNLSLLSKHRANVRDTVFDYIYSGKNTFEARNAKITDIVRGLNNAYKYDGKFVEDIRDPNRYDFTLKNIPFDSLNKYLQENIGLGYIPVAQIKSSEKLTCVIFND